MGDYGDAFMHNKYVIVKTERKKSPKRSYYTSGKLEISDQETKIFGHHSVFQGINDQN